MSQLDSTINTLHDGPVGIMITSPDSLFPESQSSFYDTASDGGLVVFVDASSLPAQVMSIITSHPELSKRSEIGDLIIWAHKDGNTLTYMLHRDKPERDTDWIDVTRSMSRHYADNQPDSSGAWRWGQIAPEDGEYLCRDCGYIEEFKKGQIFPVCEVCLAGDPTGPLELSEGYWEKL